MINFELIFPELFLSLSIMFLLILGVFKNNSSKIIQDISLIILLVTAVIIFNESFGVKRVTLFRDSIVVDYLSSFMKIITLLSAFLVLVISSSYLKTFKIFKIEYPILILSSVLGMMIMISSNDLIVFYMGLELQSLALYVLATFNRDQLKSSEAGLKYFVLSALSSGLLLYGCSLIYGFTGSTNFNVIAAQLNVEEYALTFGIVFILVGLAFKISAVPFHMWAPDVYEGSPTIVTAFFSAAPKAAGFAILIRTFFILFTSTNSLTVDALPLEGIDWFLIVAVLSAATMTIGNLLALKQDNVKRMLAYSSVAHAGYMMAALVSVAAWKNGSFSESENSIQAAELIIGSIIFHLFVLISFKIGAFLVLSHLETENELTKKSFVESFLSSIRTKMYGNK